MTTARDIMTGSAECARSTDTLADALTARLVEAISSTPANS